MRRHRNPITGTSSTPFSTTGKQSKKSGHHRISPKKGHSLQITAHPFFPITGTSSTPFSTTRKQSKKSGHHHIRPPKRHSSNNCTPPFVFPITGTSSTPFSTTGKQTINQVIILNQCIKYQYFASQVYTYFETLKIYFYLQSSVNKIMLKELKKKSLTIMVITVKIKKYISKEFVRTQNKIPLIFFCKFMFHSKIDYNLKILQSLIPMNLRKVSKEILRGFMINSICTFK